MGYHFLIISVTYRFHNDEDTQKLKITIYLSKMRISLCYLRPPNRATAGLESSFIFISCAHKLMNSFEDSQTLRRDIKISQPVR